MKRLPYLRQGGPLYAQKENKAKLSEDRPPPAGSRPRKSIRTQQPELSTITTQLSLCDGPIHRLVLLEATPRAQSHCRAQISTLFGEPRIGSRNYQSEARCCAAHCL